MRNIVLISVDTLRYDCIGYQPDKRELKKYDSLRFLETPNLDKLSERSVCFTKCISTNTYTTSAHASVLTGLYPPRHGVRAFFDTKLNKDIYTLPEILRVYGYETVFSTDVLELFEPLDINRGFEHTFFLDDHNLFKFLGKKRGNKIFLFMHLFDVHEPYLMSKYEYKSGCNNDYYSEMERLHSLFGIRCDTTNKPFKLWGDFWKRLNKRYIEYALPLFVKGVSKFDRGRFGWIKSELEKAGFMDDSLIVIFSDHGEGRCYLNHPDHFLHAGELFDNVIRSPLIIYHRDLGHTIKDDLVSLVDIFPTVVSLATNSKVEELLPYHLDGINLLGGNWREFTYSEVWTSRSPVIDLDGAKGKRFVGDFSNSAPSSICQRGIRTKDKKIVIHGSMPDGNADRFFFDLGNEEFLKGIYRYLFGREIDSEGYSHFLKELNNNTSSKEDVYRHLLESEEYKKQRAPGLMVFDLEKDPYENYPVVFPREIFHTIGKGKRQGEIFRTHQAKTALRAMDAISDLLRDINIEVIGMAIEQRINNAGVDNIGFFIDKIRELESEAIRTENIFKPQ